MRGANLDLVAGLQVTFHSAGQGAGFLFLFGDVVVLGFHQAALPHQAIVGPAEFEAEPGGFALQANGAGIGAEPVAEVGKTGTSGLEKIVQSHRRSSVVLSRRRVRRADWPTKIIRRSPAAI